MKRKDYQQDCNGGAKFKMMVKRFGNFNPMMTIDNPIDMTQWFFGLLRCQQLYYGDF